MKASAFMHAFFRVRSFRKTDNYTQNRLFNTFCAKPKRLPVLFRNRQNTDLQITPFAPDFLLPKYFSGFFILQYFFIALAQQIAPFLYRKRNGICAT